MSNHRCCVCKKVPKNGRLWMFDNYCDCCDDCLVATRPLRDSLAEAVGDEQRQEIVRMLYKTHSKPDIKQDFLAWIFGGCILLLLLSGMFPIIETFVVWVLVPIVTIVSLGTAILVRTFRRIVG